MRSGVHFAEFDIVRMDETDGRLGIRVGICQSVAVRGVGRAAIREKPSVTSGTDEYLRYLEWSRLNRAAASIFSTEHAWGFDARTGSVVHRGKRAWWRTKGVAPGVDICRSDLRLYDGVSCCY